jgi:K+-sensing histidine kinase KdpD
MWPFGKLWQIGNHRRESPQVPRRRQQIGVALHPVDQRFRRRTSRLFLKVATLDDLLWATVHQIALMLKVRVVVLLPDDGGLVVKAGFPPEDMLDEDENAGRARPAIAQQGSPGTRPDTVADRRGRSAL